MCASFCKQCVTFSLDAFYERLVEVCLSYVKSENSHYGVKSCINQQLSSIYACSSSQSSHERFRSDTRLTVQLLMTYCHMKTFFTQFSKFLVFFQTLGLWSRYDFLFSFFFLKGREALVSNSTSNFYFIL